MQQKTVDYTALHQASRHYAGENQFCSVIALAIARGCKFGKARAAMRRAGRVSGRGAVMPNIVAAHHAMGLKVEVDHELTNITYRKGIRNIAHLMPKTGTYHILTAGHISCYRNGALQDWAADAKTTNKQVKVVYRITEITTEE